MERGPHVLIAVIASKGRRRSDDGQSDMVEGIANAAEFDPSKAGPNQAMMVPVYVLAVAGKTNRAVRFRPEVEYPDGVRESFPYMKDSWRETEMETSQAEWRHIVTFPFRMPGLHWIRISINGAIKTEIPLNVTVRLADNEPVPGSKDGDA